MFVKRLIQKANTEVLLKAGNLKSSDVEPRLTVQHGIPGSASVLAYEPGQRLLAVASRDGRLKVFGREGVEVFLKSPTNAPCKYLDFVNNEGRLVHVTTRNDIEVWDLSTSRLVFSTKWGAEITAFAVIQGSSFIYVGDETGQVAVLHFDSTLNQMPYSIPAQVTLCGLVDSGDTSAPSVVSILPQPDAVHSRVAVVYANGLISLWGLYETEVLAIRGGTEDQHRKLMGEQYSGCTGTGDEDEKETCCACWACPSGSILAVGYTDGDIWLWGIPVNSKAKAEKLDLSSSPLLKLSLSSDDFRMPVVVMRWSPPVKTEKGPSGYLYVFGGQEMGMEVLTVLSIDDPASQLQLRLRGPFADVLLLPSVVGGGNAAVLVLTSPGCLDVYEETDILKYLSSSDGGSLPQPIPFKLPVTSSTVTTAKFLVFPEDGIVASRLLKIPRVLKGYMPALLPSGTRWPVKGGNLSATTVDRKSQPSLYITGHENGLVNIWDASTPCLYFLATVDNIGLLGSEQASTFSITALDFCGTTGLLAAGNDAGLVCVYSISAEPRESTCYFISNKEPSTKKEVQQLAGFQCLAVLNLHQSAIRTVVIASTASCLAIGDDVGLVSLFDLESRGVRFHGKCFGNAVNIVSFSVMSLPSSEGTTTNSSTNNSSSSIVFVLSKDASIVAIDGNDGSPIGSGRPKNPSTAVSLHLLDSSGASVGSLARTPQKKTSKQAVVMAVIQSDESGSHIEPAAGNEERPEDMKQDDDWTGSDNLLLLCSEDSLRLYSISAVLQGMRTTIRKVRLDKPCCSASTIGIRTHGSGLLLLYNTGDIEIRSLPELDILKETPLSECLNWEFESSSSFFRTFAVSSNARLAAIDADREVLFMSILRDENDMRLPGSYPLLYDKDVAAATEAAMKASVHSAKKKQSQIQDLLGGVMKEIKHSLGTGASVGGAGASVGHTGPELSKLFAKQAFPVVGATSSVDKATPAVNPGATSSGHQVESPPETSTVLDIDDIEIDDDDFKSPSPSKKGGVIRKLRNSFKGKKKASPKNASINEDEQRNMLFEGGSTESRSSQKMPAMRTADEIKAAYGKKSGEASSAAAQARDRLMERQERLQNISRRTEEMQDSAENFASMAEELAKKMEARKWWEI